MVAVAQGSEAQSYLEAQRQRDDAQYSTPQDVILHQELHEVDLYRELLWVEGQEELVLKQGLLHRDQAGNSTNDDVYLLRELLYPPVFVPKLYNNKVAYRNSESYKYTLVAVVQQLGVQQALRESFEEQSCERAVEQQQKEVCLPSVWFVSSAQQQLN